MKVAFTAFATANRTRAEKWINELPIYRRPHALDLEELKRAIPTRMPAQPIDLDDASVPMPLRGQLRALRTLRLPIRTSISFIRLRRRGTSKNARSTFEYLCPPI